MHPMSGYELAIQRHTDNLRSAGRHHLARRRRGLRRTGPGRSAERNR